MTGHTRFRKVPRRAKDEPSIGMTNLTTYDNKISSKNIHTHTKPGSAIFDRLKGESHENPSSKDPQHKGHDFP
jgi:hypothetical protein